jgi:hypothetical protein
MKLELYKVIYPIEEGIDKLYAFVEEQLTQDWKAFTITIDEQVYEINAETTPETKATVIKLLLKDALNAYIDHLGTDNDTAFDRIEVLSHGARKEDHQFEIVKSEVVDNLDADGQPITAKPLNEDSVYVQWQDENKFKFEEN